MTWTTALVDIRTHLSDGPTDKLAMRKPLVGILNGVNTIFKTFDFRVLTSFTTSVAPFGVYVSDVFSTVSAHDLESGFIVLAVAPTNGQTLTANYYHQWFNDTQLNQFLVQASVFLGKGVFPANIEDGLIPVALEYASFLAYKELSLRYARALAEGFRYEDSSGKDKTGELNFSRMANDAYNRAIELRKEYYSGNGRQNIPSFSFRSGAVRDVAPNR